MKKEETMNIVYSTDNNYVPLCGIMLTSLFEIIKVIIFQFTF